MRKQNQRCVVAEEDSRPPAAKTFNLQPAICIMDTAIKIYHNNINETLNPSAQPSGYYQVHPKITIMYSHFMKIDGASVRPLHSSVRFGIMLQRHFGAGGENWG